ncbi:hypothetical protein JJC00_07760 [Bradyrhizobium diazoefficiens]|nr:hypothetical protein JJC00_07760 [Bradyrhizobium diazoefficiens]
MVSYDVTIRNARPIVGELSLDREGFTLVQHKAACLNEADSEVLCAQYLKEMIPFIKSCFNASRVVARRESVIVRSAGENSTPGVRGPGGMAHIDYAPLDCPVLAARENQLQGIPIEPYSRLLLIQAWRALSPSPQDFPLALCDNNSLLETDVMVHDYTSDVGSKFNSCVLHYNPLERWYYFPDMSPSDLILFKGYDSDENSNARAAHAAFDNRRADPDAKQRRSIEARFFVYFD